MPTTKLSLFVDKYDVEFVPPNKLIMKRLMRKDEECVLARMDLVVHHGNRTTSNWAVVTNWSLTDCERSRSEPYLVTQIWRSLSAAMLHHPARTISLPPPHPRHVCASCSDPLDSWTLLSCETQNFPKHPTVINGPQFHVEVAWNCGKSACDIRLKQELTLQAPRVPSEGSISHNASSCAACMTKFLGPDCSNLRACSHCLVTKYCSKKCQKAHWKKHKLHCVAVCCNCYQAFDIAKARGFCECCDGGYMCGDDCYDCHKKKHHGVPIPWRVKK